MSFSPTSLPLPLISGCTCNWAGGSVLGMVIAGWPSFSVTVGSPAFGVTLVPFGPASWTLTRSTTKSSVSPTSIPARGSPPEGS